MKGRVIMNLVIAEKPSVAQSIAKVLGATIKHDGYLEGPADPGDLRLGPTGAERRPHKVRGTLVLRRPEWQRRKSNTRKTRNNRTDCQTFCRRCPIISHFSRFPFKGILVTSGRLQVAALKQKTPHKIEAHLRL